MIYEKETVFDRLSFECLHVINAAIENTYIGIEYVGLPIEIRREALNAMRRKCMRNPQSDIFRKDIEKQITELT